MKYFKDTNDTLFAFEEDGSQDHLIKPGLIVVTFSEVEAIRQAKKQAEFDALPYEEKRQLEYPPMADYLDAIVKGDQGQIDAYIVACRAVKEKYPKP